MVNPEQSAINAQKIKDRRKKVLAKTPEELRESVSSKAMMNNSASETLAQAGWGTTITGAQPEVKYTGPAEGTAENLAIANQNTITPVAQATPQLGASTVISPESTVVKTPYMEQRKKTTSVETPAVTEVKTEEVKPATTPVTTEVKTEQVKTQPATGKVEITEGEKQAQATGVQYTMQNGVATYNPTTPEETKKILAMGGKIQQESGMTAVAKAQLDKARNIGQMTDTQIASGIAKGTISNKDLEAVSLFNPELVGRSKEIARKTTITNTSNEIQQDNQAIVNGQEPTSINPALATLIQRIEQLDADERSPNEIMNEYKANNPEMQATQERIQQLNKQKAEITLAKMNLYDDYKAKNSSLPISMIMAGYSIASRSLDNQLYLLNADINTEVGMYNSYLDEMEAQVGWEVQQQGKAQDRLFQMYGVTRAEEIRQEDIMREDDRLQKEIAREEMLYQRGKSDKLDELKAQEEYNLSVGLLDKGIDPTGLTVEEMRSKYAESTRTTIASQKALDWAKVKPSGSTEAPQFKPVFNDDGTMKISENSVYNLAIGPDGNSVQVQGIQEGGYAPNGRTECGAFVNDLIGAKIFGDQLSDKTKNINSNTPVVGGAFIEDVGPYGHVGFIESINPDGSINIIDSNYSKDTDGKIRRDTIAVGSPRWNQIKGFYDPSVGGPAPLDSNTRVILNQEKSAFRSNPVIKAFEEGLQQYKDIAVSLNDTSGPGDTAGIFQFMKSLDPNSVVRETEFEAAAKSAGVFEYIGNTYDRITKGKKLSPDQALAFKRLAKAYVENRADSYDRLYDDMARTVENNGIHPSYLPTRASDELKSGNNQFQPTKTDTKETYSEYDNLRAEVATPYSIGTAESVNINKNTPGLTFQ